MKQVLAECLVTFPDENDMISYTEGNLKPRNVKIYYKGQAYYINEKHYDKDYFEIVEPKIYK